jgi:hypothetical protein
MISGIGVEGFCGHIFKDGASLLIIFSSCSVFEDIPEKKEKNYK